MKRSLKTVYKVLNSAPSTNGAAPKKSSAPASMNGNELNRAIKAVVEKEVQARLMKVREAVLKAFAI